MSGTQGGTYFYLLLTKSFVEINRTLGKGLSFSQEVTLDLQIKGNQTGQHQDLWELNTASLQYDSTYI